MRFLDLHTHSLASVGVDTPARMCHQAERLGIEIGLCDGKRYEGPSGVEVYPKGKRELKRDLDRWKGRADYIVVHGGREEVNREAACDDRVDILAHPDLERKDSGIDAFTARKAAENGVALEINLGRIIWTRGNHRVHALRNIRRNVMLARKYGAPLVVASGARSRYDLREACGVHELLRLVGLTEDEAQEAMGATPSRILERNAERRDRAAEGVRVVA